MTVVAFISVVVFTVAFGLACHAFGWKRGRRWGAATALKNFAEKLSLLSRREDLKDADVVKQFEALTALGRAHKDFQAKGDPQRRAAIPPAFRRRLAGRISRTSWAAWPTCLPSRRLLCARSLAWQRRRRRRRRSASCAARTRTPRRSARGRAAAGTGRRPLGLRRAATRLRPRGLRPGSLRPERTSPAGGFADRCVRAAARGGAVPRLHFHAGCGGSGEISDVGAGVRDPAAAQPSAAAGVQPAN